jgi:hypothetical protein
MHYSAKTLSNFEMHYLTRLPCTTFGRVRKEALARQNYIFKKPTKWEYIINWVLFAVIKYYFTEMVRYGLSV